MAVKYQPIRHSILIKSRYGTTLPKPCAVALNNLNETNSSPGWCQLTQAFRPKISQQGVR